jgi:hypothetical protein
MDLPSKALYDDMGKELKEQTAEYNEVVDQIRWPGACCGCAMLVVLLYAGRMLLPEKIISLLL